MEQMSRNRRRFCVQAFVQTFIGAIIVTVNEDVVKIFLKITIDKGWARYPFLTEPFLYKYNVSFLLVQCSFLILYLYICSDEATFRW